MNEPIELTQQNFEQEVIHSSQPVLVDFWAAWCGPCRAVAPVVHDLAGQFDGRAKVAKLDVDAVPTLAQRYGVRSIPTLLFFKDGQVVDQVVGVAPKAPLAAKLDALA